MFMRKLTGSLALALAVTFACTTEEDDDGGDDNASATNGDNGTTGQNGTTSNGVIDTTGAATTSNGSECSPEDECRIDDDCPGGGQCIACLCVGGTAGETAGTTAGETEGETDSAGVCPEGEECVEGTCEAVDSTLCALLCDERGVCPEGMTCIDVTGPGFCSYLIAEDGASDTNYPRPTVEGQNVSCPAGFEAAVTFPGFDAYLYCAPACDGVGLDAACVGAAEGANVGACAVIQQSSGNAC